MFIYSKNSSDGVREWIGRLIFFSKRSGIQQSAVVHLESKRICSLIIDFICGYLIFQIDDYLCMQLIHGISGRKAANK